MENEFFIHTGDIEKRLYMTRTERIKGTALSSCCMMPDDVDYEMSTKKNTEMLEICGMTQQGLEHFVNKYGKTYRYLSFFKCQLINDFSPLGDLDRLEEVEINWNIRSDHLWDMSKNSSLLKISIIDAKKMAFHPSELQTSSTIQSVFIIGGMFNNHPMESLECFSGIKSLKHIKLTAITLSEHSVDMLKTLPNIESFDFDAGMLTTEEIARIVALYPNLNGKSLCAYNAEDAIMSDVRVCGYKKPGLYLPKDQKRLDKYTAEFNSLVEKFRSERFT